MTKGIAGAMTSDILAKLNASGWILTEEAKNSIKTAYLSAANNDRKVAANFLKLDLAVMESAFDSLTDIEGPINPVLSGIQDFVSSYCYELNGMIAELEEEQ